MEEEIDLREYITVLLKYWKWIVSITVTLTLIAYITTSFISPTYRATANLLLLKSIAEISLEPKYQTQVDTDRNQTSIQRTMVSLATSNDIARKILDNTQIILPPEIETVSQLLGKIEVTNSGNIISISATDLTPEVAAQLANFWALTYEDYVNQLFSNTSNSLVNQIENQAQDATQFYYTTQAAWEEFLVTNQIARLERMIEVEKARQESFKNTQIAILNREMDTKTRQAQSLRTENALIEELPVSVFKMQQDTMQGILQNKYLILQQVEAWLDNVESLRKHVTTPNTSANTNLANALAFIVLNNKAIADTNQFSSQGEILIQENYRLQLHMDLATLNVDTTISVQDVDNLMAVITTRKSEIEDDIQILTEQLFETNPTFNLNTPSENLTTLVKEIDKELLLLEVSGDLIPDDEELSQAIEMLDTKLSTLQAELEKQKSQERELLQTRDLAWDNVTTVQRKLSEIQLEDDIIGSQVRIASRAIPPLNPVSPRRLLTALIVGGLGTLLTIFTVFIIEYWRNNESHE